MSKNRFQNSDIPYADRMLLKKFNTIREHRNDAARTALKISCVALNNTKKMGYFQLVQFAEEQQRLTDEYYADPEVQEKHLNDRLHKIGFVTKDGRLLGAVDADGKPVKASDLPEDDVLAMAGGEHRRQLWTGWNSIKDGPPKYDGENREYIVHVDGTTKSTVLEYDGTSWTDGVDVYNVTHWMEMPEPPAV